MIMEALTISRLLERILRKELHKVQDVVKKKTKAVENVRPSVMFSVLKCYII